MKICGSSNNRKYDVLQLFFCVKALVSIYLWSVINTQIKMKTNIYILIVFLFSVSFVGAQNTNETSNVTNEDKVFVSSSEDNTNESKAVFIEASELKEAVAKSTSDIRKYFNKTRNVDNLSLLFPKINKAEKA